MGLEPTWQRLWEKTFGHWCDLHSVHRTDALLHIHKHNTEHHKTAKISNCLSVEFCSTEPTNSTIFPATLHCTSFSFWLKWKHSQVKYWQHSRYLHHGKISLVLDPFSQVLWAGLRPQGRHSVLLYFHRLSKDCIKPSSLHCHSDQASQGSATLWTQVWAEAGNTRLPVAECVGKTGPLHAVNLQWWSLIPKADLKSLNLTCSLVFHISSTLNSIARSSLL